MEYLKADTNLQELVYSNASTRKLQASSFHISMLLEDVKQGENTEKSTAQSLLIDYQVKNGKYTVLLQFLLDAVIPKKVGGCTMPQFVDTEFVEKINDFKHVILIDNCNDFPLQILKKQIGMYWQNFLSKSSLPQADFVTACMQRVLVLKPSNLQDFLETEKSLLKYIKKSRLNYEMLVINDFDRYFSLTQVEQPNSKESDVEQIKEAINLLLQLKNEHDLALVLTNLTHDGEARIKTQYGIIQLQENP